MRGLRACEAIGASGPPSPYEIHFGFARRPFHVTADPDLFYATPRYEAACATLLAAVRDRRGMTLLTGEPGMGKTTMLRRVLRDLEPAGPLVLWGHVAQTFDEMLAALAGGLGRALPAGPRPEGLLALGSALRARSGTTGPVVFVIDEAHGLSRETLTALAAVSRDPTTADTTLRVVLVGQPELERALAALPGAEAGARQAAPIRLDPLATADVGPYVRYRLRRAGYTGADLFLPEAIGRIAEHARGVPRLVNQICDNALRLAGGAGARTVSAVVISEVARDLELVDAETATSASPARRTVPRRRASRPRSRRSIRRQVWADRVAWISLAVAAASLLVFFMHTRRPPRPDVSFAPGYEERSEAGDAQAGTRLLATGVPPDTRDRNGLTALMLAAIRDRVGVAGALLDGQAVVAPARGDPAYPEVLAMLRGAGGRR